MKELAHVDLNEEVLEIVDEAARKNIVALQKGQEELKELCDPDKILSKEITETTSTTMPGSYDGRLLFKKIKGVCEQGENPSPTNKQELEFVKGKNLLDCRGLTAQTVKGVTFTPIKDEQGNLLYIEVNGTATANAFYYLKTDLNLPNGDYCLNGYPSVTNIVGVEYYVADANAKTYGTNNSSDTVFTSANNGVFQVFIIIKSGYTATNLRFYPMIRKASIADNTFVPYGLLRVATHGKNLLNINKEPYLANYMVNGAYGFYATESCDVYRINNLKSGKIYFKVGITEENISVGLYRNDGTLYYAWKYASRNNFDINNNYSADYMLVTVKKGDNAFMVSYEDIPYEPYVESSITLSKPIDLYGIGDVQDVITPKQIKKKFAKTVIDGSVAPYTVTAGTYGGTVIGFQYSDIGMSSVKQDRNINRLCDRLQPATEINPGSYKNCKAGHWGFNTNGVPDTFFVFCIEESFTTAEQVQAWLSTHPITIVFEINEATESLPTADQIALNSLATYDGITYLEFDSEVQPTFEGEYGTSNAGGVALQAHCDSQINGIVAQEHTGNKENPHGVTKSQIGLGNVPNVATNDQTPTYTEASTLATLTSGEKVSVAFGKIKKAISTLISHIGNKENPHAVTKSQVGLGNVENKSVAEILATLTKEDIDALKVVAAALSSHGDKYKSILSSGILWFGHETSEEWIAQVRASYLKKDGVNTYPSYEVSTQNHPMCFASNGYLYYAINPGKAELTDGKYTEEHIFRGDARFMNAIKANGGIWSEETHVKKLGIDGGAAQGIEWVWDAALGRWVLCTVQ